MNIKQYLESVDACSEAVEWAGDRTLEQIIDECPRGDWLLWLAQKLDVDIRALTLAKGYCANTVRHLMTDERSLAAVDAAIAYGKGEITDEELRAAADAASAAYAAYAASAASAASAAAYAASAAYFSCAKKANQKQTADICRQYLREAIIEQFNNQNR